MSAALKAGRDERLSLRPGVYLAADDEQLRLLRRQPWHSSESFGAPSAAKRAMLNRLAQGPCTATELLAATTADAGELCAFLDALAAGGWLVTTVSWRGRDLYSMQPVGTRPGRPDTPLRDLTLSRFAVLRREDDEIVVESPLASARMLVHDAAVMTLIAELVLAAGTAPAPLPQRVTDAILRDLVSAGLAMPRSAETAPDLRLWNPHDLWFHARSRMGNGGYSGAGFGRTNWAKPFFEPPPARREPFPGQAVELHRPDLEALRRSDQPLTAVVEDRRSVRAHDDESPVTAEQLGELLYRSARERTWMTRDGAEHSSRPYPCGGAAYELELYPVVRRACGLAAGMYHYESHEHRLRLVREPGPEVGRLIRAAASSAMMPALPQVLIVVAARFGRLMPTYEELGYSLVLKHVGVLYQTMYLVATSMGLAACALGASDAMAFTEATGLDYTTESSVGEFLLGGQPPG
jgi:SagB-type dehydrogenase family enzyme